MRIFAEEEERRLYELELARGWARSSLIAPEKLAAMEVGLGPVLARSGYAIRLLFFAFSALAQGALCAFLTWDIHSLPTVGRYLLGTAVLCYAIGEVFILWFRLYRFGVEEALLAGAVVQFSIGLYLVMPHTLGLFVNDRLCVACFTAAALCGWLYGRCGYLYAALAAIAALSVSVGCLDLPERRIRVCLALLYCLLLAVSARHDIREHEKDEWQFVRAVLFLGIYLILNLRLGEIAGVPGLSGPILLHHELVAKGAFYWATFVLIWAIPAAGIYQGIKRRQRPLLAAATIASLITLMTYKPYLGLERHAWDAAILGAAMMALAAWLTRWLNSGPDGRRSGLTAKPAILARDEGLGAAGLLAAATAAQAAHAPASEGPKFEGGGGSSGGGGASGGF